MRTEPSACREIIVEDRTWKHGIEIVSHVNYSQLARVRRGRGLPPDALPIGQGWSKPARRKLLLVEKTAVDDKNRRLAIGRKGRKRLPNRGIDSSQLFSHCGPDFVGRTGRNFQDIQRSIGKFFLFQAQIGRDQGDRSRRMR